MSEVSYNRRQLASLQGLQYLLVLALQDERGVHHLQQVPELRNNGQSRSKAIWIA